MVNTKEWIEQMYSNKEQVKIIELVDEAEGELVIENFSQLEEIKKKTEGEKNITKLIIKNCPFLRKINCYFCRKIKELIIENCPQINEINCDTNQIENLELSGLENLVRLNCSNNRLTNLNVRNNQRLSHLSCEKNKLQELDLGNNPAIIFLDANDNPLNHSPYFFSKKRKSKMKDLQDRLNWGEQILAQTLEENEKKIAGLESRIKDLKFSLAEEQTALAQEQKQNQELCQDIFSLQEKMRLDGKENTRLTKQIEKLIEVNQELRKKLFQREIQDQEKELKKWIDSIKSKIDEDEEEEELNSLIEAQIEFINSESNYACKQLEKGQKRLLKNRKIKEREIEKVLQLQVEIISLKKEAEVGIESLIEIIPK